MRLCGRKISSMAAECLPVQFVTMHFGVMLNVCRDYG